MLEEHLMESKEKVKVIASSLRKEVLEPAKKRAFEIIAEAEEKACFLEKKAEEKARLIEQKAEEKAKETLKLLESSLHHAKNQALEKLRQQILEEFFKPKLKGMIEASSSSNDVIGKLIQSLAQAVARDGIQQNLSVLVAKNADIDSITNALGKKLLNELKIKTITLGSIKGGIKMKLDRDHVTLDCSDEALFDLLEPYIREDLRRILFLAQEED